MYAEHRANNMPNYKFIYFNAKGRGELVRYIFAQSGVKYEDSRVDFKDWPTLKPDMPFGQLPVLEVDGQKLAQSGSIARYLAKVTGLAGKTALEQGMVDSVVDALTDLREKMFPVFFEKDEDKKKELVQELLEKTVPNSLGHLEKILSANKGGDGFLVGDNLTYADLLFYSVGEMAVPLGASFTDFPKLAALYTRVGDQPRIAEYIKSRPE